MSEWWTYRLTSFLLFSPRTYYRTIELYNLAVWPLQLVGVAIGIAIVALLVRKQRRRYRIVAALLAVCWLWIAWAFHYQRYAQINWAASWIAVAFALEALLLVAIGSMGGRIVFELSSRRLYWIAIALITIIVVGYPLLAPLTGRSWTAAEVFGTAADPTALATVAILALIRGPIRWILLMVPLLWCSFSALTLWAMKSPEALIVAVGALLALLASFSRRADPRADRAAQPAQATGRPRAR
jgi:hypothetical protein